MRAIRRLGYSPWNSKRSASDSAEEKLGKSVRGDFVPLDEALQLLYGLVERLKIPRSKGYPDRPPATAAARPSGALLRPTVKGRGGMLRTSVVFLGASRRLSGNVRRRSQTTKS